MSVGDKLVYSTEVFDGPCSGINMLLERYHGDKDAVIESLIRPPCDIGQFAQIGIAYGACLGMTPYEFMIAARRIRKGKAGLEGKVPKRSTK